VKVTSISCRTCNSNQPISNQVSVFADTIYAERYLGLPAENKEGYEAATVMNKAKNFADSSFYLIHGTADGNHHVTSV